MGVADSCDAPQNRAISEACRTLSSTSDGCAAPTAIRLDGNFARRRFPPTVGEQTFWDSELPGFGLRVRKNGGVGTFIVTVYHRGRRTRLTLGRAGEVRALDACAEAKKALAATHLDGRPKPPPKPTQVTLAAYADEFIRDYGPRWKPSTRKRNANILRLSLLPVFGSQGVAEIAQTDIVRWRDSHAGAREAIFNRAVPVLSVMLQYAEQLGLRRKGSNPCRGTERYKRQFPERYLSPAEYRHLGRALATEEAENPAAVAAIRLLLFTGARCGEIETLRWDWVKPDRLALPDSKTGAKTIYLNAPARRILASLAPARTTLLVFPSNNAAVPIRLGAFWTRFRRSCALPDVRLHDLRHSFASTAIMDGVPLATIGKLLGHQLPETTARYAHLADDTIAEAAERVSGSLARCLGLTI